MDVKKTGTPILEGRHDLLTVEELCTIVGQDQFCSFNHGEAVVGAVAEHRARLRDRALGLAREVTRRALGIKK